MWICGLILFLIYFTLHLAFALVGVIYTAIGIAQHLPRRFDEEEP